MPKTKVASKNTPAEQFVTKKEFEELNGSVNKLVDLIEKQMTAASVAVAATPEAAKQEKAIVEAGPNQYTTDTDWDAIAREVIGEAVDHTEVERKAGGVRFTVVIKKEFSNASKEYLQMTKMDRRTREVGAEGTEGVSQYCKLIRANLARPNTR